MTITAKNERMNLTIELEYVEWLLAFYSWLLCKWKKETHHHLNGKTFRLFCILNNVQYKVWGWKKRLKSKWHFLGLWLLFDVLNPQCVSLPFLDLISLRLVLTKCAQVMNNLASNMKHCHFFDANPSAL